MRMTSLGQMTHSALIDTQAWHSLEQQEPAFLWACGLNHKTPDPLGISQVSLGVVSSCLPILIEGRYLPDQQLLQHIHSLVQTQFSDNYPVSMQNPLEL